MIGFYLIGSLFETIRGQIMHPSNYDLTVQHQRLEVERACRHSTLLADGVLASNRDTPESGAIEAIVQWFLRILFPARSQRAAAD